MAVEHPEILWENVFRLSGATVSVSSEVAGNLKEKAYDYRPKSYWYTSAGGTQYLRVNCGASRTIDMLCMMEHNLFSQTATVKVWETNASWVHQGGVLGEKTPGSDEPFYLDCTSTSAQYFEVEFTGLDAALFVGVIFLGETLELPRNPGPGFNSNEQIAIGRNNRTMEGQPVGTNVRYIAKPYNAQFFDLDITWVNDYLLPFLEDSYFAFLPFFLIPDKGTYSDRVYYMMAPGDGSVIETPWDSIYQHFNFTCIGVRDSKFR